jgi:hypothetical protein
MAHFPSWKYTRQRPRLQSSTPVRRAAPASFDLLNSGKLIVARESLQILFDKLSRKANTGANGARVGSGWVKYEWNDGIWNLDDGQLNLRMSCLDFELLFIQILIILSFFGDNKHLLHCLQALHRRHLPLRLLQYISEIPQQLFQNPPCIETLHSISSVQITPLLSRHFPPSLARNRSKAPAQNAVAVHWMTGSRNTRRTL